MKIAIQGHPTRGKEVIQILESLDGINRMNHTGCYDKYFYYISVDNNTIAWTSVRPIHLSIFTLEEFEKEFPFKIGDKVRDCSDGEVGVITGLPFIDNMLIYNVDFVNSGQAFMPTEQLKPYKEMKEERNIKLTLDKAKEWYKKGGELREIALQAFTEKELNPLPRSWEEFCKKQPIKKDESYINSEGKILSFTTKTARRDWNHICPSQKSAEAHLAMMQLEQLRDCWRQGWIPKTYEAVYTIKFSGRGLGVYNFVSREFLSFPTKEMAEEFLECFRDLIEQAGDLI